MKIIEENEFLFKSLLLSPTPNEAKSKSCFRLSLSDLDTAKGHLIKVNRPYNGIAVFKTQDFINTVASVNNKRKTGSKDAIIIELELVATPLSKDNEYYDCDDSLTTEAEGNPFHCDINYDDNGFNKGKPNSGLTKLCQALCKEGFIKFFLDKNGKDTPTWDGASYEEIHKAFN
ncbi:hypothetical protein [Owenweeksia hongkongensis]|uniref:hypothetical protein n=1 Tax=Owenweeksia hongkongensis TaxID=253245 RepID=UPI003A91EDC3